MSDITGEIYQAASGQWSFRVMMGGEEIVGGGGFADPVEADCALSEVLASYAAGDDPEANV